MITSYWKLKNEVARQRQTITEQGAELAQYRSLHGADMCPGANLDTGAWRMFADLDADYRALEKTATVLRRENLTLARENQALKDRMLGWDRL